MNKLLSLFKIFMVSAVMCLSAPAFAIDPGVSALITEGDNLLAGGDTDNASISYVNAKGLAADKRDWEGMLTLSNRFLTISSEYHGKDCFLIASQIAHEIIDRATGDQTMCDDGINTLRRVSLAWEVDLIDIEM